MKISKVRSVKTPVRGTPNSAGIDFFVPDEVKIYLKPGESCLIPSGIKANVPACHALMASSFVVTTMSLGLGILYMSRIALQVS